MASQMGAASFGETMACLLRVPTEVVKQRMQAGMFASFGETVSMTFKNEGMVGAPCNSYSPY